MIVDLNKDNLQAAVTSLYNVRDLGGYITADGHTTAQKRFVRSDAPVRLPGEDLEVLRQYPVSVVIDLRSECEIRHRPSSMIQLPGIDYVNIPMLGPDLDADISRLQSRDSRSGTADLADLYRHMIDTSQQAIATIMHRLAQPARGARLFHCTHGKDRTGLIAALLLGLVNVREQDIIDNYSISASLLKPWFDTFLHRVPADQRRFFITPPDFMKLTLDYLSRQYGGISTYLAHCGVDHAVQARLKSILLDA